MSWQNALPKHWQSRLSVLAQGNVTDGQILVMHDAFGITGGHIPKFAKNFLAETGDIRAAVRQYMAEVESGVYPGEEHSFH